MIQNSAMLVDLNISVWTGRKMDKKVSDEIDASKNTKARAGNYHKKLLAGTQKLEQLQKLVATIRIWHADHSRIAVGAQCVECPHTTRWRCD